MKYVGVGKSNEPARVDMRSDTVTQPTEAMRAAMMAAPVGDDVYGDDPTVNALQDKAAKLLGMEAALFVSSGTQSNLCAMLAHCQRGEEILCGDKYHVFIDEAGGASVLGGIMFAPLPTDPNGAITVDAINATVKPDDEHCPISSMLSLENTWSGRPQSVADISALAKAGKAHGLSVHLDGARLMNAIVALGVTPAEMLAEVDSVSLCLSKGLGTPAGSILAGPKAFIRKAHRARKLLGGGMRQIGVLAAAGIHALDHHVERMADDHANAIRLAEQMMAIAPVAVDMDAVQTNMVFITVPDGAAGGLRDHLASQGILIGGGDKTIRLVTHLDCGQDAVDMMAAATKEFFA